MIYQCWKTTISKKCDSRVIRLHLFMFLAALAMCATSCIFRKATQRRFPVLAPSNPRRATMRNMVQGPWESVEGWQRPEVRDGDKPWPNHVYPFGNFGKFTLEMFWWLLCPPHVTVVTLCLSFFCGLRWFGTVSAHCGYSYKKKDRCIARIA